MKKFAIIIAITIGSVAGLTFGVSSQAAAKEARQAQFQNQGGWRKCPFCNGTGFRGQLSCNFCKGTGKSNLTCSCGSH